jgi:hypothetical protein
MLAVAVHCMVILDWDAAVPVGGMPGSVVPVGIVTGSVVPGSVVPVGGGMGGSPAALVVVLGMRFSSGHVSS